MYARSRLAMRRLIVKAALALMLTFIVLLSSVNMEAIKFSAAKQVTNNGNQSSYYFTLSGVPSSATAGQSFSGVTVTVYFSNGTVMTNYNGQVYFTST